uniref:Cytochrome b n=1 Tax=Centrorhynchus clitorideus TaxID=2731796 RepID=A0A6M3YX63_9BILA|nr:cytochrome b [Centrorhynchus clitorideus]
MGLMKTGSKYLGMVKEFLVDLPTPVNINYWYGLGVALGMIYVVQIVSGMILSMFYSVGEEGAFWAVVNIMREVGGGWVLRLVHSVGVSVFFLCVYLHLLRGLTYGSFEKTAVWVSGVMVLFLLMGVSFLGYVLPWGGMSYWGMTVVTSMLGAVPYVGSGMVEWLWGGGSAGVITLSRFYSLHYLVSLVMVLVIMSHMVELHEGGSSNPLGVSSGSDKVVFHEMFSYKDVVGLVLVMFLYWWLVLGHPYYLMDSANFEEVSFVKTPVHIKPEWYFLFVYCVLRSVASKLGGVVMMVMAIAGVLFMVGGSGLYRVIGGKYWKGLVTLFVSSFVVLTVVGGEVVEYPYGEMGQVFTLIYFAVMGLMALVTAVGGMMGSRCG